MYSKLVDSYKRDHGTNAKDDVHKGSVWVNELRENHDLRTEKQSENLNQPDMADRASLENDKNFEFDDRINESFSVAGSFPIWLRSDSRDYGDYEQTIPEFYKIANYPELYFLSSYGDRSLYLFYNEFDPCCFSGEVYNQAPFVDSIKTKLSKGVV